MKHTNYQPTSTTLTFDLSPQSWFSSTVTEQSFLKRRHF